MHPKEARKQKTGTGRLAALSLSGSEIIVDTDFTHNRRLNELLRDPALLPVLLYPSRNAWHSDSAELRSELTGRTLLVIILDATWFFARKMLRLSRNIQALPALSFTRPYRSQFVFKQQPHPHCLSTIESAHALIEELKEGGLIPPSVDSSPLLKVFQSMIDYQLASEQQRHVEMARELYPELFAADGDEQEGGA